MKSYYDVLYVLFLKDQLCDKKIKRSPKIAVNFSDLQKFAKVPSHLPSKRRIWLYLIFKK